MLPSARRHTLQRVLGGMLLVAGAAAACTAERLDLENRACSSNGECMDGYECDEARNVCVREGTLDGSGGSEGDGAGSPSSAGTAGSDSAGGGALPVGGSGGEVTAGGTAGGGVPAGGAPTAGAGGASVGGSPSGGTAGVGTGGAVAGSGGEAASGGAPGAGSGGTAGGGTAGAGGAELAGGGAGGAGVAGSAGVAGGAGVAGSAGAAGDAGSGGAPGCPAGFGECDGNPDTVCETDLTTSVDHCGGCNRPCSDAGVASLQCEQGVCTSTCGLGRANCSQPSAPNADDGCEAVANQSALCGGCGNTCSHSGYQPMACSSVAPHVCACTKDNECRLTGQGDCTVSTGLCECDGTECRPGEICVAGGSSVVCSCNGSGACSADETCCQSPAGCVAVLTDPDNCGGCGRACPPGFDCVDGDCMCDGDGDCNAGSAGSCDPSGVCVCDSTTCNVGQRCLPDDSCG